MAYVASTSSVTPTPPTLRCVSLTPPTAPVSGPKPTCGSTAHCRPFVSSGDGGGSARRSAMSSSMWISSTAYAAEGARSSSPRTSRAARKLRHRLPDRQRHFRSQRLEHDPHRHPERHRLRCRVHHVADETRSLLHLDEHEHEREQVAERGQERLVGDDVGVHPAATARREPLETAAALPVERLRWPVHGAGRRLALQHQLAGARALPERTHHRVVEVGQRVVGMDRIHAARRTSALVASPDAPVTSVAAQPGTWLADVPRICRTASRIRLKPWTYASESPPPDVSTGSAPPSSIRPPSVKGPPSPRLQKP